MCYCDFFKWIDLEKRQNAMYTIQVINQGDVLLILQYLAVSLNWVLANYFFKVPLGACPFVVALLPPPLERLEHNQ